VGVPVVKSILEEMNATHIFVKRGYGDFEKSRDALWIFVMLLECRRSLLCSMKAKVWE
jgi:hypothetical protein